MKGLSQWSERELREARERDDHQNQWSRERKRDRSMGSYNMRTTHPITLEDLVQEGVHGYWMARYAPIECADGFVMSVQGGAVNYCAPRYDATWPGDSGGMYADKPGPFTHLEVGFPTQRPEPWAEWEPHQDGDEDPTQSVYAYVPVELIAKTIALHGGQIIPEINL